VTLSGAVWALKVPWSTQWSTYRRPLYSPAARAAVGRRSPFGKTSETRTEAKHFQHKESDLRGNDASHKQPNIEAANKQTKQRSLGSGGTDKRNMKVSVPCTGKKLRLVHDEHPLWVAQEYVMHQQCKGCHKEYSGTLTSQNSEKGCSGIRVRGGSVQLGAFEREGVQS